MTTQRDKVFAFLDEKLGCGAGCTITDYDSAAAVQDYAIEEVGEDEELTCMCGVGPLMGDIEDWVKAFAAGERNQPVEDEFCLSIRLKPAALGFTLFRTSEAFDKAYANPQARPKHFPVFVREIPLPNTASFKRTCGAVLTYLYLRDVTVMG